MITYNIYSPFLLKNPDKYSQCKTLIIVFLMNENQLLIINCNCIFVTPNHSKSKRLDESII